MIAYSFARYLTSKRIYNTLKLNMLICAHFLRKRNTSDNNFQISEQTYLC